VNAITEEFYDEEYKVALGLDPTKEGLKSDNNNDKKPLYGVPISVKDCIKMKNALETGGLACRTHESLRAKDDSVLVHILRVCSGALPIVRGNVGQIMMLPESENFVWGRSCNPWDLNRTPGGSSGGDATLVAMKCVPMAVGSDVAGSIRIPASFCGVVGFKPSSMRLSNKGSMRPRKDNKASSSAIIKSVPGPIAKTVDDCALFMKSIWIPEYFQIDTVVPPIPFNCKKYEKTESFKIGYFVTDDWFEPCTAAKRGLLETICALEKAGHECVPFDPPVNGWESYSLIVALNAADGNMRQFVDALEGEKMIDSYMTLYIASNLPNIFRSFLRKVVDKRRATLLGSVKSGGLSVHEYWGKISDLISYRAKWERSFIDEGIEAVIHPALPLPAFPHGASGNLTGAFSYTVIANMLNWPAGVVPVTVVREDEQHYRLEDIPKDQRDKMANLSAEVMSKSVGLPLNVAVMTPEYQDENCLRIMKEIEKIIKFDSEPSAYKK